MHDTSTRPLECITCRGLPCTYRGEGGNRCLHPLAYSNGTVDPMVLERLTAPPAPGSQGVEFYGRLFDVNKAVAAMQVNLCTLKSMPPSKTYTLNLHPTPKPLSMP